MLAFQFGVNYGFRRTLWALAGLSCGLLFLLLISLLGLDALQRHFPSALPMMKLLGAGYLIYLAVECWKTIPPAPESRTARPRTDWRLFRKGILVSLSNPKAILFFAAFFPKFIVADVPLLPQYLLLAITCFTIETVWQLIYTLSGTNLTRWLAQDKRLQTLNRLCAGVFFFIAITLAYDALHTPLTP